MDGEKRFEYPQFYWVQVPLHKMFPDNEAQRKFNITLEVTMKNMTGMCTVKIKEVWSPDNNHLVLRNGTLTTFGVAKYWSAVDAALKFNMLKHEQFLRKEMKVFMVLMDRKNCKIVIKSRTRKDSVLMMTCKNSSSGTSLNGLTSFIGTTSINF